MTFDRTKVIGLLETLWPAPARITNSPSLPDDWYVETETTSISFMVGDRVIGLQGDEHDEARFVLALKDLLGERASTVWFTDAGAETGRPIATIHTPSDVWTDWVEVPHVED